MLNKMERHYPGLSGAVHRNQRRRDAVMEHLKEYVDREKALVLPKSSEGMVICNSLSNWCALCRYTKNGDQAIYINASKKSLRRDRGRAREFDIFGD